MTLDRTCEECGTAFVAKTRRARFCGATCRVRANRRPTKTGRAKSEGTSDVVELKVARPRSKSAPKSAPELPTAPPVPPVEIDGGLATQIRSTLQAAGALETVAGMAALMLARQIEKGQDSGSAVATMTKELSRLMGEARAEAAPQQRDAADDVMARAAAKIMRLVGESA